MKWGQRPFSNKILFTGMYFKFFFSEEEKSKLTQITWTIIIKRIYIVAKPLLNINPSSFLQPQPISGCTMKSIILNPKFTSLSSNFPKLSSFSLFSHPRQFNILFRNNPSSFSNPLRLNSTKPFIPNSQNRTFQASSSTSGDIHVIVGPMFAGKTSSLIRRIQSESANGRSTPLL